MEIYEHPVFWFLILCHLIYAVQLALSIRRDISCSKVSPSLEAAMNKLYLRKVNVNYVRAFLALNYRLLEDPRFSQLHKQLEIELSKFASAHPNLYRKGKLQLEKKALRTQFLREFIINAHQEKSNLDESELDPDHLSEDPKFSVSFRQAYFHGIKVKRYVV